MPTLKRITQALVLVAALAAMCMTTTAQAESGCHGRGGGSPSGPVASTGR